ncbi:MAG: exodeoxyribonuclease VII small subunit [Dehalococcoidia bacterium]
MAARSSSPPAAENEPPAAGDDSAPESFEAAFARLEEISNQLEAGGLTLERSVDLYEEGMRLAARCQELLTDVEQRIETLRQGAGTGGDAGR